MAVKNQIIVSNSSSSNCMDSIGIYLKEIGRYPLLNHAQELELAEQIQAAIALPPPPHTAEQQQVKRQGDRARQRLVNCNMRLVVSVAKKYQNRGLDLVELIQEGSLGLIRGAEKFDPTKGYKFSTYAYWWIRQGITRAIATTSRTIRLPVHIVEKLNKVKRISREFSVREGRSPSQQEIATALDMTITQVRELLQQATRTTSLDRLVGESGDTSLVDLLPSGDDVWESVEASLAWERSQQFLDVLNDKERAIVSGRYGFDNGQEKSLATIGRELDISRERVRQIEGKAFLKLRKARRRIA